MAATFAIASAYPTDSFAGVLCMRDGLRLG